MVLMFLVVAFVYSLLMGRNRLVTVILGTYFSFLIVKFFPWKELSLFGIKESPGSGAQIFIFLAIILGFYFLLPHSALGSVMKLRGRGRTSWWQSLILSILQIGLILSVVIGFLSAKIVAGLSPIAKMIFIGSWPQFIWLFLPILAIMFLRRKRHEIED